MSSSNVLEKNQLINPYTKFGNTGQCNHWGFVVKVDQCLGCKACMAACAIENQTPFWEQLWRTHVEDLEVGEFPTLKECSYRDYVCNAKTPHAITYALPELHR
jgi:Fe-S-cluster-containing hydrogenase components 1